LNSPLGNIYQLKEGIRTKRFSSYDRTGGNKDSVYIEAGETAEIAAINGAGIIKHIWITIATEDAFIRRNAVIRMYWDGEEQPSVESPIGDFFGQGWGEAYNFVSLPLAAAPQKGKALNSYFPMPFGSGAVITVENQSDQPIDKFYYYIDYEEHTSMPETAGRFHAWWNRELTEAHPEQDEIEWNFLGKELVNKSDCNNYVFANIQGKGQFIGINYYVDSPGPMWYGEGDDMWMIDGEAWPGSLHGTGTEDFFNNSWGTPELYLHPYFGVAKIPNKFGSMGRTHCYRFFLEEPIYFDKSLKASIEHGHANCLTLDLSTVAYWYQTRANMPLISYADVHLWRHEWRKALGNSPTLWGNERKKTNEYD
jgi:hypothetical protein